MLNTTDFLNFILEKEGIDHILEELEMACYDQADKARAEKDNTRAQAWRKFAHKIQSII